MNRSVAHAAAGGIVAVAVILSACSPPNLVVPTPSATPSAQAELTFRTEPCNLGEFWDRDALTRRAEYTDPTVSNLDLERYGPMIANDTCSDADILNWQELRRNLGESDGICRIAWYDDPFVSATYSLGCVVPLVVSDAAR